MLSNHLGLEHKLYLTDTVPIPLEKDKKPKGIKRLTDLINFKIDIADLMKHID